MSSAKKDGKEAKRTTFLSSIVLRKTGINFLSNLTILTLGSNGYIMPPSRSNKEFCFNADSVRNHEGEIKCRKNYQVLNLSCKIYKITASSKWFNFIHSMVIQFKSGFRQKGAPRDIALRGHAINLLSMFENIKTHTSSSNR